MTDAGTDKTKDARSDTCPQCHRAYTTDDRFCRNCGFQLHDDYQAVDAHLTRVLPERIDAALALRFRDQKIVEVETAQKLAERAMGWLKLGGFFVGIPLLICGIALSLLGIKTYSDLQSAAEKAAKLETVASGAETRLGSVQQRVGEAETALKAAQKRVDETETSVKAAQKRVEQTESALKTTQERIDAQIAQLDRQQRTLQSQVQNIQDRLEFCSAKGLTADMKRSLQETLDQFIAYLEKVGFTNLTTRVSVCIFSKEEPIPGSGDYAQINTVYNSSAHTLYIHKDLARVPSVVLRAYMDHALLATVSEKPENVAGELTSGLGDYFSATFLDNPLIGEGAGSALGVKTSYLRNLAIEKNYPSAGSELFSRGEIWGAALWQCRRELSQAAVDKIALQAWRDTAVAKGGNSAKIFSAALVKNEAASGKPSSCFDRQILQRNLPH